MQKILRSLKHTEDATTEEASPNIYTLCDMALAIAAAIARNQQSGKAKGKQPAAASCPGNVPLPSSFYRSLDMRISGMHSAPVLGFTASHCVCKLRICAFQVCLKRLPFTCCCTLYRRTSLVHVSRVIRHLVLTLLLRTVCTDVACIKSAAFFAFMGAWPCKVRESCPVHRYS